ncbi:phosphotriesterase-related protein [Sinosporangium album]|uniref:Phosphotriesterase-related protein n=1 Tax=Sinosporangium album TaxID=504805 RepID=A0A1G7SAW0_9ACTN|nr:aryldialkylphosphatase [Sinosporangium album]SDG20197.1 phosphotriesterase-related protein [Sinosporangium album]
MREPLIRTVAGPVPASGINGTVLPHEHLRVDLRWGVRVESDPARWLDEEQAVTDELRTLRDTQNLGLVVEQTCLGMGRDAISLTRVAAASHVAVVAATGLFTEPFTGEMCKTSDIGALTDHLLTEIFSGLDGTNVIPGVIGKVGTWGAEPTPAEERALIAAARASRTTGLPVSACGGGGFTVLEILLGEDLPGRRIAVAVTGPDPAVLRKIAGTGAYITLNTLDLPLDHAVRIACTLMDEGHTDRLLVSTGLSRVAQLRKYDGPGYGHCLRDLLPALRRAGADDAAVRAITHTNPLAWLTSAQ